MLRGWCNYFRHGGVLTNFGYLAHYTWTRVVIWLRDKHRKVNWTTLRRRWLCGYRRWWPTDGQQELFDPNTVPITRYRYRSAQIPSVRFRWSVFPLTRSHPSSDLTRHVESRMRGNAHTASRSRLHLANTVIDDVRVDTRHTRASGHAGDPLYGIRRVLLTGAERLTAHANSRLAAGLQALRCGTP